MAKKPKNTKKSRFGNPAKASADAAARTTERSSAEARLDRAMGALSSGYVDWLETESRPDKSIDVSLAILDDFFDMYRILEPYPDPTNLVPAALREVVEVTAHANPLGVMTLRNGVHDYVAYLAEAGLWSGTHEDLMAILDELAQTAVPGVGSDDEPDYEDLPNEDYEFAEIYLPTVSEETAAETAENSPLWKNILALLEWIGDGKEFTEDGILPDQEGAAATLINTGVGALAAAARFTTPADHSAARLALYWELLEEAELVTVSDTHVRPSSKQPLRSDDPEKVLLMRDLMGHFIFTLTLEGSEEGIFEDWHVAMADWLTQSASAAPPEAAQLIQALEEPDSVHPDLLAIAQNIAHWAEEGLVTVGEFIEVLPAWRPDVFDILKDAFPVHAAGPGAE
ncbi:hypothetical protein AAGW05_12395 [Arthrobacter sp. LAPM80]|uniref:hypothetical protein n=1 Tax=Arthrobacter sp. LAPM80 TaxID=3141788 RepID=UPI00398AE64E